MRILYKMFGLLYTVLLVSCGSSPQDGGAVGSVVVKIQGLDSRAMWSLAGPGVFHSGSGDKHLESMPVGPYTITWSTIPGYYSPSEETAILEPNDSIVFDGQYYLNPGPPPGFVFIPSGAFYMGAPEDELGYSTWWILHYVTLSTSFYKQPTEVTNQQFLEALQWAFDNEYCTVFEGCIYDNLGSSAKLLNMYGGSSELGYNYGEFRIVDRGHGINPNHPVREVTWFGAAAYCDWLNLRNGLPLSYDHNNWQCNEGDPYRAIGFRLPNEAEWEYACRAGSATGFSNGPITNLDCDDPVLDLIGWYCGNSSNWTHEAGSKAPNAWGLYDMHGNLSEACNDWLDHGEGWNTDPVYDPIGPATGYTRVYRGGMYDEGARLCLSAYRYGTTPGSTHSNKGFRVVQSAY
jgi:formylglycine-generating enzyme required for sulfatase activity